MDEKTGEGSKEHDLSDKAKTVKRILSLIVLLAFLVSCGTVLAASAKGNVYVIDDFSGGLTSKISPYGLPPKYSTIAENVRFNTRYRSLARRANLSVYGSADTTEAITGIFRHYKKNGDRILVVTHGDEMETGNDQTGAFTTIYNMPTGDTRWQFATWHDILLGTDGYNRPIKYDGSSASVTHIGSLLATLDTSGSGPATGDYTYKVSCYSTSYETILDTPSNTITADGNDVLLSMIPICPDTTLNGEATLGRKIYRTESGGSTYKLLSNGTINNNTAVTLTDSDADGALGASYPAGDATWAPPKGKFILVQNNRLFLANDPTDHPSRVWFSDDSSHDIFQADSYKDVRQNDGDAITFMKGVLGILTIGKNNSIQKIYIDGADPATDWSTSDPLSYVGCQAPYSVSNSPLGLIYLAKDGIYRFNGQYSELLSETVTPEIKDIAPTSIDNADGIYHDSMYYLAYNSETAGGARNNRVLVLDVLAKAYSIDTVSINAFAAFNSGNDWGTLYAGASDSGYVYAFSDEVHEVVHKRHSDFTGLWDDMRYIPESVGGDQERPILEIADTETIDESVGTIDDAIGIIDRQDAQGYYVSQPLIVGANAMDKIFWREVIPSTGGDVTFRVRTSATGEENLLLNDDFEFWDNWSVALGDESPNDWAFAEDGSGGSADQESTNVKRGTYSTKLTKSDSGQSYIYINVANATNYQGKTLVFNGWAKSANSVASKVRIQITDGHTTSTADYSNGGDWEELQTTIAVNAAATTITAKCVVETGADAVAYFDRVMVLEGTDANNDWSAWSSSFTNSAGADLSGVTAQAYAQYLITMTADNIANSPNIVRLGGYNVRMTYSKEGTAQTSSVPFHYRTGYLDLGHPLAPKIIRAIEVYHTGEEGEYTVSIENEYGDSDSWDIDISSNPMRYTEKTTGGAFRGELFVVDVSNVGSESFIIDRIVIHYDMEPYVANDSF